MEPKVVKTYLTIACCQISYCFASYGWFEFVSKSLKTQTTMYVTAKMHFAVLFPSHLLVPEQRSFKILVSSPHITHRHNNFEDPMLRSHGIRYQNLQLCIFTVTPFLITTKAFSCLAEIHLHCFYIFQEILIKFVCTNVMTRLSGSVPQLLF